MGWHSLPVMNSYFMVLVMRIGLDAPNRESLHLDMHFLLGTVLYHGPQRSKVLLPFHPQKQSMLRCTGNGLVEKPSCRCRFSTKHTNVCQRGQSRGNVLSKESKESQSDQAHRYQVSLHSTTYQFKSARTRVCSNGENGRRYDDERTPQTQIWRLSVSYGHSKMLKKVKDECSARESVDVSCCIALCRYDVR